MATQISEQNRLRGDRAKQQAGEQRFLGLQQLGQYQPEELQDPQVQGQMEQAKMDMLGGGDKYLNYQLDQQKMEADALYRKNKMEAEALHREQQLKGDASTPKIAQYIGLQTDAIESAENVLQKYLAIDNPTPEQKEKARIDYGHSWRANREAMAQLGGHAKATGQDYTKLPTWGKALKDGITFGSAEELNDSLIQQAKSRANLLKAQESDVYGEIGRKQEKFASEMSAKLEEKTRKALSDQKLAHPNVYTGIMEDAKTAKEQNNIYAMVKLLANVIEPGMNVADTEVEGYLQGGENKLSKMLFSVVGAGEKDMDKLANILNGLATNRAKRAQGVLETMGGSKTKKKTASEVEQELLKKYL
jgi:hypothetical protein